MRKYAIIVAGGSGSRMKREIPKQFLPLNGKPILLHTLEAFQAAGDIEVILVLPETQISFWNHILSETKHTLNHRVVKGGNSRFQSVKNGLDTIPDKQALVAVHDGVRPLITPSLIAKSYSEAEIFGSAIAAVPLKDSIRNVSEDGNTSLADRDAFRLIQTPQTFRIDWMKEAFRSGYQPSFTDCASVVENAGFTVHLIEGDYRNIKITTPEDLLVAEALLKKNGEN